MRKTDDETILKMLKEGKTQKQIAEHFKVSPVAIHKRVKRLLPQPKSLEDLTEREQKFVIEKAKGKTATQAVMNSYETSSRKSAKVIGSQLMAKPEIQMAISELMEYHGLTRSYRIRRLKDHVDNRDPDVSLRALDQSWKLDGSYAPEKHLNLNLNLDISDQEREALQEMAVMLAQKVIAVNETDIAGDD
jgi:hypothetical protein